ncbi:MAG TPA: alpha/beta hydrolase [Ilumatobacteraceae bacterium]|nr:alpha/beta hydrolase [Ilumatobacteraceae bacterium]
MERLDVWSSDGTPLAVWVEGQGPPLVLVHGSFRDHTTFEPLLAELRTGATTYAMDRRGFGGSGDAPAYAIEREFEDVAAVADAVAARTGSPVALFGHSFGASCVLGGAELSAAVDHLIAYEPSLGIAYPPGSIDAVAAMIDRGDVEDAIVRILVEMLGLDDDAIAALRAGPQWPSLLAAGPTVVRECRAEDSWADRPFRGVTAATLLLTGSASPPAVTDATRRAAAAINGAEVLVLDGHAHFAHKDDPAMIADVVLRFVRGRRPQRSTATAG